MASVSASRNGRELVPVSATRSDFTTPSADRERNRHAGERKVDRTAHAYLGVGRRRRRRRQMHRHEQFVVGEREVRAAVLDIEIGERDAPAALVPGDLHLGTECHQCRRKIAAEGRMAALALRRDVADVAACLRQYLFARRHHSL